MRDDTCERCVFGQLCTHAVCTFVTKQAELETGNEKVAKRVQKCIILTKCGHKMCTHNWPSDKRQELTQIAYLCRLDTMAHYLASWPIAYALSELRIYFGHFSPTFAASFGKVVGHKNDRICVAHFRGVPRGVKCSTWSSQAKTSVRMHVQRQR